VPEDLVDAGEQDGEAGRAQRARAAGLGEQRRREPSRLDERQRVAVEVSGVAERILVRRRDRGEPRDERDREDEA
jgi:hypothetical protein